MSSLYDRLDFTRPKRQQLKNVPIWERIDLTRPPKLRCCNCRVRLQSQWEFCPSCGQNLVDNSDIRRCIWVDVSGMEVAPENSEAMTALLLDAFSKLYGAFRSVKVFLTSQAPDEREWGENLVVLNR